MRQLWKKTLLPVACLTLLLLCCSAASAQILWQKTGREYGVSAGITTIIIAWDAVSGAVGYQIELLMVEPIPTVYAIAETSDTNIPLKCPRDGHFVARVRSWNWKSIENSEKQFSEWAASDDPTYATVDGQPMGWWIYAGVPAPEWE